MNIVVLTNDNYFSFAVSKDFFNLRKEDVKLVVFSTAIVGKKSFFESIRWVFKNTGLRHTLYKLMVYGVFKFMKIVCNLFPFIPNNYSSLLWVKRHGLDYIFTSDVNSPEVVAQIKERNPDLIVSVSMNQIVKEQILEMPPKKCLNVHCAPLPRYGGMSPYVWALANNEDHSAATIHYMTKGFDEGDIIVQSKVDLKKNDSAFSLFYRCCLEAKKDLIEVVNQIENDTVKSYEQDLSEKTYYSWPTKECIGNLKRNGFSLATISDFFNAIFRVDKTSKPSVFITYGWCRSSYSVVKSLGQRSIDVHIGDESPLAMSRFSRYCKSFTKLPDFFIEPKNYFDQTCRALKKTGAKVLLPCHEDVGIFAEYKDRLPDDIYVAIPQSDNYSLAEDKFDFLQVAQDADCPVPKTLKITSLSHLENVTNSIELPLIVKARTGNSAKGVAVVHSREQVMQKFQEFVDTHNLSQDRWPIVQEFLPGAAAGVCVLYEHGHCVTAFAEKYLRCKEPGRFGTSTLRETFDNHWLISRAVSVMDKLQWHGVAHLDFVADKDGVFKLIEINPRLWGAMALSVYSGIDFPYLWYLTAIGKDKPDLAESQNQKIKCRWIIGDCMAFMDLLKRGKLLEALHLFAPQRKCYHDDFSFSDPAPLMFEIFDYFSKFIKAGGVTNPVRGNMIR